MLENHTVEVSQPKGALMRNYDAWTHSSALLGSSGWEAPRWCGSDGANCVEVNLATSGIVGLRDSKLTAGPVLLFTDHEWRAFIAAACAGQYDR